MRKHPKGAGNTEYIIVLAIVLAIILVIFWKPIKIALQDAIDNINADIEMRPRKPSRKVSGSGSESGDTGSSGSSGGGFFGGGDDSGGGSGSAGEPSTGPVRIRP